MWSAQLLERAAPSLAPTCLRRLWRGESCAAEEPRSLRLSVRPTRHLAGGSFAMAASLGGL
eukprot:10407813-Alexandrium_andersonii.AAC.1